MPNVKPYPSIMALVDHGQVNLPHAQKSFLFYPACPMSGLSHGTRPIVFFPCPETAPLCRHTWSIANPSPTPTMNRRSNCGTHRAGLSGRASRHDLRPSLVTLCRCCHWPTAALVSTLSRSQLSSRTDSPGVLALPSGAWQRARTIGDGTPIASMMEAILRHRTLYCPVFWKSFLDFFISRSWGAHASSRFVYLPTRPRRIIPMRLTAMAMGMGKSLLRAATPATPLRLSHRERLR